METPRNAHLEKVDITMRLAEPTDLPAYTDLLQRTYENAFVEPSIGLTKECFSKEVFNTQDTQDYLKTHLITSDNQKTWLAFHDARLVGTITITEEAKAFDLKKFYVDPEYQGRGVGRTLWEKVMEFARGKNIVLSVYAHNQDAIEFYKRRGFEVDTTRGEKGGYFNHWPEWPDGVQAWVVYMRRPHSSERTK